MRPSSTRLSITTLSHARVAAAGGRCGRLRPPRQTPRDGAANAIDAASGDGAPSIDGDEWEEDVRTETGAAQLVCLAVYARRAHAL
jgi:hypothetical protein